MNYLSDYGSGTSSNASSKSWLSSEIPYQSYSGLQKSSQKAASFQDLVMGRCTLEDIMRDLQMNGSDTPSALEDKIWSDSKGLIGMGPSSTYLRQKSWPEPDSSPLPRLPRPTDWPHVAQTVQRPAPDCQDFPSKNGLDLPRAASDWMHGTGQPTDQEQFATSTPIRDDPSCLAPGASVSAEQLRVLNSLPNAVLFSLLQDLEQSREERRPRKSNECRFCKNNGEREAYYRSHCLKDGAGRVACPVLRAFVCKRCGASGDAAHTTKYCPLSTADERMKSAAMMRSVRMASGRRRCAAPPAAQDRNDTHDTYVVFGDATPSAVADGNVFASYATAPLDPSWAALEQKLLL